MQDGHSGEGHDEVMQDAGNGETDDVNMEDCEEVPDPYHDTLYDMHSLVHYAVKQWIQMDDDTMKMTLRHFENAWQARGEFLWRLYLPHTLRLLEESESDRYRVHTAKFDLCFRVGKCLSLDHRFHMAIGFFEQVLERRRVTKKYSSFVPNDSLLFALGNAYLAVGRAGYAIPLLEAVVHTQRKHLGRDTPACQRCERALASAYIEIEETTGAGIRILEDIMKMHKSLPNLNPHDPRSQETEFQREIARLETECLLGRARLKCGQTERAIESLEQTVEDYKRLNSQDEYDEYETNRLMAQHWLAKAYKEGGYLFEALHILEPVVDEHQELDGMEDPYRLLSRELLAEICIDMDNLSCGIDRAMNTGMRLRNLVDTVRGQLETRYPAQPRSLEFYRLEEFKEF
ncbi:hypothetical protein PG994_008695 [Apiospora phragmitis]|uniref:Uncharacterized protein n=1 Tax=Apiospora phragmitis TaxID=2905665 RepID=A0ABR1UH70_9PEZI